MKPATASKRPQNAAPAPAEPMPASKKLTWEEALKETISLDEFFAEAKSGLKKAYADARRAGLIAG